jgi:pseudoazurin
MRKLATTLILSATLATALPAVAEEHKIQMLDTDSNGNIMVFDPPYIKINKGDTVTFVATSPGHNIISRLVPAGAENWKGEVSHDISVTLDTEGVYIYECDLHKFLGMVGVIQVGEATNLEEAKKAAAELTAGMAMSAERINNYLSQVK